MKKLKNSISTFINGKKAPVTMDELISYPKDTLGFHVGSFLFNNSHDADPQPEITDIYRVLINKEVSDKEEIAMHYYLFGNGDLALKNLFVMATGALFFPHHIMYFYQKYRDGRNALRFYDLNHFSMLHLPLERIKDTFLIR
jgi:ubiquinone biosynthesis protein Coq4